MKNVSVRNASDFAKVCKANLRRISTHLMAKEQLLKAKKLNLWSVSPDVKGISKPHVAVMNGVLRIWHKKLNIIYPPICLA